MRSFSRNVSAHPCSITAVKLHSIRFGSWATSQSQSQSNRKCPGMKINKILTGERRIIIRQRLRQLSCVGMLVGTIAVKIPCWKMLEFFDEESSLYSWDEITPEVRFMVKDFSLNGWNVKHCCATWTSGSLGAKCLKVSCYTRSLFCILDNNGVASREQFSKKITSIDLQKTAYSTLCL